MKTNMLSLSNLADAYRKDLFILRVNPSDDYKYDLEKKEDRQRYYDYNAVFALGKLTGNHYAAFERAFGKSLDRFQTQWLAAVVHDTTASTEDGTTYDEDTNTYHTPAGKLVGSPETNILQVVAFLFSCFGRVVDEDEDGEYVLEQTSQTEMLEYIDLNALNSLIVLDEPEADSFVWRVLGTARGFSLYPADDEETPDDDPKNSIPAPKSSRSTKGTPRKSPPKK